MAHPYVTMYSSSGSDPTPGTIISEWDSFDYVALEAALESKELEEIEAALGGLATYEAWDRVFEKGTPEVLRSLVASNSLPLLVDIAIIRNRWDLFPFFENYRFPHNLYLDWLKLGHTQALREMDKVWGLTSEQWRDAVEIAISHDQADSLKHLLQGSEVLEDWVEWAVRCRASKCLAVLLEDEDVPLLRSMSYANSRDCPLIFLQLLDAIRDRQIPGILQASICNDDKRGFQLLVDSGQIPTVDDLNLAIRQNSLVPEVLRLVPPYDGALLYAVTHHGHTAVELLLEAEAPVTLEVIEAACRGNNTMLKTLLGKATVDISEISPVVRTPSVEKVLREYYPTAWDHVLSS